MYILSNICRAVTPESDKIYWILLLVKNNIIYFIKKWEKNTYNKITNTGL